MKSFGEIGKSRTSGKEKLLKKLETKVGRSFFGEFLENKWKSGKRRKAFGEITNHQEVYHCLHRLHTAHSHKINRIL